MQHFSGPWSVRLQLDLKLLAIGFAGSSGMRWLWVFHHPCNAAVIGLNRRLGFVGDDPRR